MNFESIHNYYERLVIEEIMDTLVRDQGVVNQDLLEDVACVALNRLPPRYVRFEVDMAFYMTTEEREQMENAIHEAVAFAWQFVSSRHQRDVAHEE